eukprot:205684_1
MSVFAKLNLVICTITSIIGAIDIPITCTRTDAFAYSSGNPGTSTVTCASATDTMVSCGIWGRDARPGGTYIDPTTDECTAYDLSDSHKLLAVAHCCAFPSDASITTTTTTSSAGESVSAQCPAGSEVTGCSARHVTGNANLILGTFAGIQTSPPQTVAWIDTKNTCNAVASTGTTVEAVARCVTVNEASYVLDCQTQAAYHAFGYDGGTCDTGYDMMACHAFAENGNLDAWYVSYNDECYAVKDGYTDLYTNAICCKLILTTFSPTTMPTQTPTQTPTNVPTQTPTKHPTLVPSQTPTQPPTNVPTQTP